MAGHSKWSNIKRKKSLNDSKKSQIFTKLVKELTLAVRHGGEDPTFNPRLRLAIQNAKGANMPKEAILRAIQKRNGDDGAMYQEVIYEGYGSHGVAIMVSCMTDKTIRTVANIRATFARFGGSLEKSGSLSFLFSRQGVFIIPAASVSDEEAFTLALIDSGVEALEHDADLIHIICEPENFGKMQAQLEQLAIVPTYAGLEYIPHTLIELPEAVTTKLMKLIEALNEDEDVQKVYHNMAI